jgi:NAD(P) transhydrogenase
MLRAAAVGGPLPLRPTTAAALLRRLGAGSSSISSSKAVKSKSYSSTTVAWEKAKQGEEKPVPLGIPYHRLTIGIPREIFPLERRVAATPESVARLVKPGFSVQVETMAGSKSFFADADYQEVGATIVDNVYKSSDIILKVCTV